MEEGVIKRKLTDFEKKVKEIDDTVGISYAKNRNIYILGVIL